MADQSIATIDDQNPMQFADDGDAGPLPARLNGCWKVMIVDDDETVHSVTDMVLRSFTYKGRGLEILHGHSGIEARELMRQHPDTAVLIIDVVMESDSAGLDAVRFIREQLQNHTTRIILRTGQPGQAPEEKVVREYDINDYKEKGELTVKRLEMALITSLRSYDDIVTIRQLSIDKSNLETLVAARTHELSEANANLRAQIEESRRANAALQRSEQRLAEAHRIARIGNFDWNLDSGAMFWSSQIYRILDLRMTGHNMEQPHPSSELFDAIPGEEREWVRNTVENALREHGCYEVEHRILGRQGVMRHVRQMGELVADDSGIRRVSGTLQDITERHQAQAEIRKLTARVLLRVAQDAIAYGLATGKELRVDLKKFEKPLLVLHPCFVTLTLHGEMRGRAGTTQSDQPLVQDIASSAYRAAFADVRFPPLTAAEFRDIEIHLALLSPAEELEFGTEEELAALLHPNIDGVVLSEGQAKGVLLPDAWTQYPQPRDFLTQLKLLAGLASNHWSSTLQVSRFTVENHP